jgi:localization factor PodJL
VLLAAVAAYGAQRQVASLPGISLLGNFLVPEMISEAETRAGVDPHHALATGSIAPLTSGEADTGAGVSEALPAKIGPESLLKAAIAGDPTAQFVVAGRYLDGRAVARDERLAAQWYDRAAKQGLAAAQYRLGSMYEHGRGVANDREQAKSWYERAAGQGNINAMHNLAVLHADAGRGERNYQMAAKWFHKAAERGLKDSQFNLAVLSEQGLGVARSPQEAVFWYSLAAAQGDSEAAAKAKAIEATLAEDLAKQVHARLLAWRAVSADRNANVVPVGDPAWLEMS